MIRTLLYKLSKIEDTLHHQMLHGAINDIADFKVLRGQLSLLEEIRDEVKKLDQDEEESD